MQRRPFEFLPMSLKNVRGVFQTSSDVITFLGINTDKLYTSDRKKISDNKDERRKDERAPPQSLGLKQKGGWTGNHSVGTLQPV